MQNDVKEALDRVGLNLRVDAFNGVLAGKPDFTAMIVRDDEPGCASILAQQMQDQVAEDILTIVGFARRVLAAQPGAVPDLHQAVSAADDVAKFDPVNETRIIPADDWTKVLDALSRSDDAAQPGAVAGDVVTVPREPTEAMVQAGIDHDIWCGIPMIARHVRSVWAAMLAAASSPAAPTSPEGEG